ncbi:MAG: CRISPR-associated helicase Cas3' [Gemmatimonadales bacterium]|nr:CRISPR-associated helicase Cas3' [Gemmatimonadales bacterium]
MAPEPSEPPLQDTERALWAGLWAKTDRDGGAGWHPLALHLADVAACADALMAREPEATRDRLGGVFGMGWTEARPWLLLLVACHDLGKACPSFQAKWPGRPPTPGLRMPQSIDKKVNHGFVGQVVLTECLLECGWPTRLAGLAADAVGCHHGSRASERDKEKAGAEIHVGRGLQPEAVRGDWIRVRALLFAALRTVFGPLSPPDKSSLSGPDFMLLAGLTSFADWIGSNEGWFPFGSEEECVDLSSWYARRRMAAELALDKIGWTERTPLVKVPVPFGEVFPFPPRPLQQAVIEALGALERPAVLLVEAPMGEGKTEAAFYAHLELQRRFGHRGMYVALPTKATGNAMFERTLAFLHNLHVRRTLDLQLLHGGSLLNDTFQQVRLTGIADDDHRAGGEVRAAEWFTNKKRALLSEYGVGTVDQALITILPVRHNFVRLWGLANRVVVLDEIHAYDDYTGTLLVDLLRWLNALGSSVVLLSATLSSGIRRRLADALGAELPTTEPRYPRLSVLHPGAPVRQRGFEADPNRRLTVLLEGIPADLPNIHAALCEKLPATGTALALVNTVQRAQDLFRQFPEGDSLYNGAWRIGKRLPDGTELVLFHARFPADQRQARDEYARLTFGANGAREGRKILIATQVAEQSLDLDFDLMVTDLAPIDLILQRGGRLWRHRRDGRPVPAPTLVVAGLDGVEPPSFKAPLWWGAVYREDLLLRTWCLLQARRALTLPDEIDTLVEAVYEETVEVPANLQERLQQAAASGVGGAFAQRQQAKMAIIGLPDDASWNDPSRYVLFDEDEPEVHRSLMALTRLGRESALVIPLRGEDKYSPAAIPDRELAAAWFGRGISVSRPPVVQRVKRLGVPEGWAKSPLLRNSCPLVLDGQSRWVEDPTVRLDAELGLVYDPKEPV